MNADEQDVKLLVNALDLALPRQILANAQI
jgi:hypothetical protein